MRDSTTNRPRPAAALDVVHTCTRSLSNTIYVGSNVLAASLLLISLIAFLYSVFMRYVLFSSPAWADELPSYLCVWMVCFATSSAVRDTEHIAVTLIVRKLPERLARAINVVVDSILLALVVLLAWQGFTLAINFSVDQQSPSLGISMLLPYLSIPVGAILMGIHLVDKLIVASFSVTETPSIGRGAPFLRSQVSA